MSLNTFSNLFVAVCIAAIFMILLNLKDEDHLFERNAPVDQVEESEPREARGEAWIEAQQELDNSVEEAKRRREASRIEGESTQMQDYAARMTIECIRETQEVEKCVEAALRIYPDFRHTPTDSL